MVRQLEEVGITLNSCWDECDAALRTAIEWFQQNIDDEQRPEQVRMFKDEFVYPTLDRFPVECKFLQNARTENQRPKSEGAKSSYFSELSLCKQLDTQKRELGEKTAATLGKCLDMMKLLEIVTTDPQISLQNALLVEPLVAVPDGEIVRVCIYPFLHIVQSLLANPKLLFEFAQNSRKFEEFIAAMYERMGFDEVILTPRSGDGGRDVIAIKKGLLKLRVLEQTKAYSPGRLVTHDDVSAMLGVSQTDTNSSKLIITTTSDFQPEVKSGSRFRHLMPYRLELRNGHDLMQMIMEIEGKALGIAN